MPGMHMRSRAGAGEQWLCPGMCWALRGCARATLQPGPVCPCKRGDGVSGGCTPAPSKHFPGSWFCRAGSLLALPWECLDQGSRDSASSPCSSSMVELNFQEKSQELVSQQLCEGREDVCLSRRAHKLLPLPPAAAAQVTRSAAGTHRQSGVSPVPPGSASHRLPGTCKHVGTDAENPLQRPRIGWQVQLCWEMP